jgi:hypothetical protein
MNPINTEITEPTAAPEVETIVGYPVHPAANLLPAPTPEEYERLKADIKEHGLLVPIVITRDGQIIDGRTRARICDELRINYTAYGPMNQHTRRASYHETEDPVGFVLSMNAARRHLSATKIVEIYLEAHKAKLEADQKAAKAAQRANLKQGEARGVNTTPSGKLTAKIAEATGVSESTVKNVLRGKKAAAPEGTPPEAAGESKKTAKEKAPATKAGKKVTGKGYKGYLVKYGTGRHSIEALIDKWQQSMAPEIELQTLADAKRMGHPKFNQWMEEAADRYAKVGAVLRRLRKASCPTGEEISRLLDPEQEGDEAAGDLGAVELEP